MKRVSAQEVHAQKVAELGLDSTAVDLTSSEAIAGALRRAGGFLCPCTSATLVRGVVRPLRGLADNLEAVKVLVEETLEAMVAHGDFIEHRDMEQNPAHGRVALLYAAPSSFVSRQSGAVILLGIASDQLSALPNDLESRIEYVNHLRRLNPASGEDLRTVLIEFGLVEISYNAWLRAPAAKTPAQLLSRLGDLLDSAQPSRDIPGLMLLDPNRPVRYYRSRWAEPGSHSGRYVARRSQAYGADLWSYVQLREGNPERLIDFPIRGSRWRGCDEAWHLQMAIDAKRGEPQRFRIRPGPGDTQVVEFLSPVPMWARRRWDAIGEPVTGSGFLFAYKIPEAELAEELRFARDALWLEEMTGSSQRP